MLVGKGRMAYAGPAIPLYLPIQHVLETIRSHCSLNIDRMTAFWKAFQHVKRPGLAASCRSLSILCASGCQRVKTDSDCTRDFQYRREAWIAVFAERFVEALSA